MSDKPCPECGHREVHEPVESDVAAHNSLMTVMCTKCGNTYPKPAEYTNE